MKQRGIHDVFHSSLLCIHSPNDDRRFPGRLECQLGISLDDETNEWAVDRIVSHYGRRTKALFEILWKSGDKSWMPYDQAKKLQALPEYLEAAGVADIKELSYGAGKPPAGAQELLVGSMMDYFWAYKAGEPLQEFLTTSPLLPHSDAMGNKNKNGKGKAASTPAPIYAPTAAEAPDDMVAEFAAFNKKHSALQRVNKSALLVLRPAADEEVMHSATLRMYAEYSVALHTQEGIPARAPFGYVDFAIYMNVHDSGGYGWMYVGEDGLVWEDHWIPADPKAFLVEDHQLYERALLPGQVAVSQLYFDTAERLRIEDAKRQLKWQMAREEKKNKAPGSSVDVRSEEALAFSAKKRKVHAEAAAAVKKQKLDDEAAEAAAEDASGSGSKNAEGVVEDEVPEGIPEGEEMEQDDLLPK
ncbi:hypothetical protein DFH06DRAFT_1328787 [Mycena polygramma]|nr:hypothetical protein DFH06DRAFT_1328787 [Mycena polygramma]